MHEDVGDRATHLFYFMMSMVLEAHPYKQNFNTPMVRGKQLALDDVIELMSVKYASVDASERYSQLFRITYGTLCLDNHRKSVVVLPMISIHSQVLSEYPDSFETSWRSNVRRRCHACDSEVKSYVEFPPIICVYISQPLDGRIVCKYERFWSRVLGKPIFGGMTYELRAVIKLDKKLSDNSTAHFTSLIKIGPLCGAHWYDYDGLRDGLAIQLQRTDCEVFSSNAQTLIFMRVDLDPTSSTRSYICIRYYITY